MFRILSRGVVAAIATISVTVPAYSQGAGAGPTRPRDSIVVRITRDGAEMSAARVDSIKTLFRVWDREGFGTPESFAVAKRLDSLLLMRKGGNIFFQRSMSNLPSEPRGWIGFNAQGPSQTFFDSAGLRVTYFAYPSIISIDPESPAERAGIVRGDVLVAYNGVDVVGHELNLTRLQVPDSKVTVTVRREGEAKDYAITVAKTPVRVVLRRQDFDAAMPFDVRAGFEQAQASAQRTAAVVAALGGFDGRVVVTGGRGRGEGMPGSQVVIYSASGVLGASMVSVGADLSRVLKLDKGMLITEVAQESAAWTSGLRAGDLVVSVAGKPVTTLREVQALVRKNLELGEAAVALQIVRDKKPKTFTVTLPSP
ncbi:MAG: PDZ domain-containing protein [bacterium]